MRAIQYLEEIEFRGINGPDKGNVLSMHWNRFDGTRFKVVDSRDKVVTVREKDVTFWKEGTF